MLLFERCKVDAAPVETRRRSGLQPPGRQLQLAQAYRERNRRHVAHAAAARALQANVDEAV